jgi:hypothetical protein
MDNAKSGTEDIKYPVELRVPWIEGQRTVATTTKFEIGQEFTMYEMGKIVHYRLGYIEKTPLAFYEPYGVSAEILLQHGYLYFMSLVKIPEKEE